MSRINQVLLSYRVRDGVWKLQVHNVGVPYWFLPDEGGTMTPATYEEMADTSDVYLKVSAEGDDGTF